VLHPGLVLEKEEAGDSGSSKSKNFDIDDLIRKFNTDPDGGHNPTAVFAEGVLANLADDDASECPICFDVMQIPTIIPGCAHQW
jgi:DNA repair protein RAD5